MTFTVGLTGGIGSGKSTVACMFETRGIKVIDSDAIAHELTAAGGPATSMIQKSFGNDSLNADGSLNRATMRQRVFSDANAKRTLENILHPLIQKQIDERVAACETRYVLLAIPLLVETGNYLDRVDRVLVVDCAEEVQITRTMARNRLSRSEVDAIMAAQTSRAERIRFADDIVLNNDQLAALIQAVAVLDQRYSRLIGLPRQERCD